MPCNHFPFHSLTISNNTLQIRASSLRQHHLTRALPSLYLLPTKSHNVVLLEWPPVPDSMLFFNPFQTVKPLGSWLPGASNESFIKAPVSCVAHLFSQLFQAPRALPNCLRMDDLSEDPEEIETSVSITRSLWHAHKDTHTYKETQMETWPKRMSIFRHASCVHLVLLRLLSFSGPELSARTWLSVRCIG